MSFWKELTTANDNVTHDAIPVILTIFAIMLPVVMVWGIIMDTLAWIYQRPFDMQGAFVGVLAFLTGVGAFLSGGGFATMMKERSNSDGSTTTTETVTNRPQAPAAQVNVIT
jgi:riboflavin transporter FmnP